jgi:signal transduction histidine kinase
MIAQDIELEMRLIEDLLNVARIHLGKLGMAFEIADAYALLHSALGIWANEIADENLAVQLDLQAWEYCLPADSGRLQQVFWNLLKNAVKFTPPDGKVTLRLDLLHGTNLEAERQVDRSGRQVIELHRMTFEKTPSAGARAGCLLPVRIE